MSVQFRQAAEIRAGKHPEDKGFPQTLVVKAFDDKGDIGVLFLEQERGQIPVYFPVADQLLQPGRVGREQPLQREFAAPDLRYFG